MLDIMSLLKVICIHEIGRKNFSKNIVIFYFNELHLIYGLKKNNMYLVKIK